MFKKVDFDLRKEVENFLFDKYIFILINILFVANWLLLIVVLNIFVEGIVIFFFSMYGLLKYINDFEKRFRKKEGDK